MSKASIPVALNGAERLGLNFILNVVCRCGRCNLQLLAAESGQHIRRHCELLDALGLEELEDLPRDKSDLILREGLADGAPKTGYRLGFEAARYLLGHLERRIRYSPIYWALETLTVDLKTALDVSFFREDYEKSPKKVMTFTAEERERLLLVYKTNQICLGCQMPQDGPATVVELQHRSRAFEVLGLRRLLLDADEEGSDGEREYVLEEPALAALKDLAATRALIIPGGPRKLMRIIDKIETAKQWEPLSAVADVASP